jgi:hypothetical protein
MPHWFSRLNGTTFCPKRFEEKNNPAVRPVERLQNQKKAEKIHKTGQKAQIPFLWKKLTKPAVLEFFFLQNKIKMKKIDDYDLFSIFSCFNLSAG